MKTKQLFGECLLVNISMIGYLFEYQDTLGDVGTGRWRRSDQSMSSTTPSEKTIGRARTLKGVVE